jgi:hypothetical protein
MAEAWPNKEKLIRGRHNQFGQQKLERDGEIETRRNNDWIESPLVSKTVTQKSSWS